MCDARLPPNIYFTSVKMAAESLSEDEDSSLAEDVVEIPENLNWIYSGKGKSFFRKVLNTVGIQESETIESSIARILSRTDIINSNTHTANTEVFTDFLKELVWRV